MAKQTIKLTQKSLINYLRKSCELHKCDDDAVIYISEEHGITNAQYFPSENGPSETEAPKLTALNQEPVNDHNGH